MLSTCCKTELLIVILHILFFALCGVPKTITFDLLALTNI